MIRADKRRNLAGDDSNVRAEKKMIDCQPNGAQAWNGVIRWLEGNPIRRTDV